MSIEVLLVILVVMVIEGMREEQQTIGDCEFEDQKLSEKMMTVDCLRGRLLAERNASKAAKEEVELIEKRLEELERQVKSEAKFKKKAEKILKLVLSKLEALKIPSSPTKAELRKDSKSCSTFEDEDDHSSSLSDQCSMVKQEDFTSNRSSGSTSLGGETESQEQDFEEKVDNSLALVKVEEKEESRKKSKALNSLHRMDYEFAKDKNVYEVLMALRNAREQLQASVRRTADTVYRPHSMGLCEARDYILKSPIM